MADPSSILRDCSDLFSNDLAGGIRASTASGGITSTEGLHPYRGSSTSATFESSANSSPIGTVDIHGGKVSAPFDPVTRVNSTSSPGISGSRSAAINLTDPADLARTTATRLAQSQASAPTSSNDIKRVKFKNLLSSNNQDNQHPDDHNDGQEDSQIISEINSSHNCDSRQQDSNPDPNEITTRAPDNRTHRHDTQTDNNTKYIHHDHHSYEQEDLKRLGGTLNHSSSSTTSSSRSFRANQRHSTNPIGSFGSSLLNRIRSSIDNFAPTDSPRYHRADQSYPYTAFEDRDLLTGAVKYPVGGAAGPTSKPRRPFIGGNRSFRGSYRFSRGEVGMAIFRKSIHLLFQKSTAALLGAFLIHVTLGTVYTLSNINSYLTSYMRKHGSPNATYGGSVWISSAYAIGQGFSMVLGGYLEKRFSARVACSLGCALHSLSIMATSWTVDHGYLSVLASYGFIPGFGCGLAYMTPMTNGFGWFPNRKGLVAGVILAGFGIGTFVFNMAQTAFVNPENLSPPAESGGYFVQNSILERVPHLFIFIGSIYAVMQFIGCCLIFRPPNTILEEGKTLGDREDLIGGEISFQRSIRTREFAVLFAVYGITTQGVLFVNSMLKEYGQIFIGNDMYLAWTGSMASIANSLGRLVWGVAIDSYSFTQCFTCITIIFGTLLFIMPFEFVLSSKLLYLLCTLGIFGSFSGWMSTYPVHISRVFGRANSGMIYGLIFIAQSVGSIGMALGSHYLIDHYSRFVPFFCVVLLQIIGLTIYHLFYPK